MSAPNFTKYWEDTHDIKCPYCGNGQEVCRDDGHGCEEDTLYEDECGACGKTFVFETDISIDHTAYVAPCLNGGLHILNYRKHPRAWPEMRNRFKCENCKIEIDIYGGGK